MRGSRGGGGTGDTDPPEKSQTFGVSGSPRNHKATKPAFNIGPAPAHQRNAIKMAFHWRADDGPLIVVFGSSLPSSPNKKNQSWTPPLTKLSGSAHVGVSGYNFKRCIILSEDLLYLMYTNSLLTLVKCSTVCKSTLILFMFPKYK